MTSAESNISDDSERSEKRAIFSKRRIKSWEHNPPQALVYRQGNRHLAVEDINETNSKPSNVINCAPSCSMADCLDRRVQQFRNPASAVEEPSTRVRRHGRAARLCGHSKARSYRVEEELATTFGHKLQGASCQGKEAGVAILGTAVIRLCTWPERYWRC